jgi:hypothetical protein
MKSVASWKKVIALVVGRAFAPLKRNRRGCSLALTCPATIAKLGGVSP